MSKTPWMDPAVVQWTQWLLDSHRHWTGRELMHRTGQPEFQALSLFESSPVVVSHGVEADPVLNYGNRAALILWELTWEQFVVTPSRLTAEPVNQAERLRMLDHARTHGYFDGYRGVRITGTRRKFLVENALIWNVIDFSGRMVGQAATFSQWTWL